jgi:hypothetical protein
MIGRKEDVSGMGKTKKMRTKKERQRRTRRNGEK